MAYHTHRTRREEEDDVVVVVLTLALLASLKVSRNRCYLTRPVLVSPNNSPWQILRASGDEKAFIITTGLSPAMFNYVLDCGFRLAWDVSTITRHDVSDNGKPRPNRRSIDADAVLGLVLHYLNSCMAQFTLQEIFGIVPSVCTRYIRRGLQILLEILRVRVPEAKIKWPKSSELQLYSELIRAQHPMLRKGFGFVDGLHLPVEASGDIETQNADYNGWVHAHFTSNVFVFSPLGTILYAAINAPGSFHDAAVARELYQKLLYQTERGYWLIADSAFPATNGLQNKIKTPLKSNFRAWPEDPCERATLFRTNRQLVSARQAAEWGMRALQGSFGRLKVPLPANDNQYRRTIIETCCRLHQLRVRLLGISEIRAKYEPVWKDSDGGTYADFGNMIFKDIVRNDRVAQFYNV